MGCPTPAETMVAALIACTNVTSHKCAKKHGVELKAMTIDAEPTLDRRSPQLLEEIEVALPKIGLLVDVTTDASETDLEKVRADLPTDPCMNLSIHTAPDVRPHPCRFCPISKVVSQFGHGA